MARGGVGVCLDLVTRGSQVRICLKPLRSDLEYTSCSLIIVCEEGNGKPVQTTSLISFPGDRKAHKPDFKQRTTVIIIIIIIIIIILIIITILTILIFSPHQL